LRFKITKISEVGKGVITKGVAATIVVVGASSRLGSLKSTFAAAILGGGKVPLDGTIVRIARVKGRFTAVSKRLERSRRALYIKGCKVILPPGHATTIDWRQLLLLNFRRRYRWRR
jgi:hypothetical protein